MADSFEARKTREREKALRKYGPDSLAPAGKPEYDILDFAINETVGMDRYAEMIYNRFYLGDVADHIGIALPAKIHRVVSKMELFAQEVSTELIEIRNDLMELGLDLGKTEDDVFIKKE